MSKKFIFQLTIICSISLVIGVLSCIPSVKEAINLLLLRDSRTVIAKVRGDLNGKGEYVTFIKVQTRDSLSIEAYQTDAEENLSQFINRAVLQERRDAHFNLKGRPTNLALFDVDHDGILELIVPTFDESLIARLRIFRFHIENGLFETINPGQIQL